MNALELKIYGPFLRRVVGKLRTQEQQFNFDQDESKVDSFDVLIDRDKQPYLAVVGLEDATLDCLKLHGERYAIPSKVDLALLKASDFRVIHFYKGRRFRYQGLARFVLATITRIPYARDLFLQWLDNFKQKRFNATKLVTKRRIELLNLLIRKTLDGQNEFDTLNLMVDLYSIRSVARPDWDIKERQLEFYLESLVATGDLKFANNAYRVNGQAIRTIEEHEEQEIKHRDALRMQRWVVFLTFLIVLLTLVQAGLVKLPPILDLSGQKSASSRN